MVRFLILLAAATAAQAQKPIGTQPKASAAEYPVQAVSGLTQIGAEYMVHSFSSGEQMFIAENVLVVEVALYPPKGEKLQVDTGSFSLRVNGKKALSPENPAMVASTLRHPEWQVPHGPQASAGIGGIGVGTGGARTPPPFPGDPNRVPTPPRVPDTDPNVPAKETVRPEELLIKTALPDGTFNGPASGFLYFPWRGKAGSIKSIDLLYNETVLRLR